MTQPQPDTLTPYAPLPVRARGTLEIFDTAFKLFRRYAGVLLAWSALSSLINLIPILGWLFYIFTMPLMFGAVSCVVAGAVRGQNVSFKQIWGFTKPRYGALLGVLILAVILMSLVGFALLFVVSLIVLLFAALAYNFGWFATIVAWIIGILGGTIGASFLLAVVMGWFNLAPVIACLEDANRGTNALTRAFSLLSGNWRKACGVATILALAGLAAFLIIFGFIMFFFYGGWDKFIGADTSFASGLAVSGFFTLFFVAWTPLQAVVGAVFYLDLRTRKEALDLEWTNYAAKPETLPVQERSATAVPFSPTPPPSGGAPYTSASSFQGPTATSNQPQTPVSVAQSPVSVQGQSSEVVAATSSAPSQAAPDSFAAFASQMETEKSSPNTAPTPVVPTVPFSAPIEVQAIASPPAEMTPTMPPVVVQPEPVISEPPTVPVEGTTVPLNVAPTFGVPVNEIAPPPVPVESPPIPVAPETPAVAAPPPVPEVKVAPAETSSFAPRRFRRAASEDEDYPSSFGGGAR